MPDYLASKGSIKLGDDGEKPGQKLPKRGSFEIKPEKYLDKYENGAGRVRTKRRAQTAKRCQIVHMASSNRRLADPRPDPQSPIITGRYQEVGGEFTFLINQAGTHIECWVAEVLTASTSRGKVLLTLGGDLQKDGTFSLYTYPDPAEAEGKLQITGRDKLLVTIKPKGDIEGSHHLILNAKRATLSENAIKQLPAPRELIASFELAPLTRQYLKWLKQELSETIINDFIKEYIDIGGGTRVHERVYRGREANRLDKHIGDSFSIEKPDGWHKQDLELARHHGQLILAGRLVEFEGVKRSQLDWIQIILSRTQRESFNIKAKIMPNIRENLKLSADGDGDAKQKPHKYKVEMIVGGLAGDLGIGLGGFIGTVVFEKITEPKWKLEYLTWFGGISAGLSIGLSAGFRTTGTAETYASWTPADVPGWMSMLDASAKATLGIGGGYGGTAMMVYGNDIHAPMVVDFTGWTVNAGAQAGAEVGESWGYIHKAGRKLHKKNYSHIKVDDDYTVEAKMENKIHFRLGDALLTDEGRQALRIMAAKELVGFGSDGSRIVLDGHADRVDCDERNIELSELRAKNTVQALKDILGDQIKLKNGNIKTRGLGERRAKESGDIDHKRNRKWRRVDAVLNSRLVVRLKGQ